MKKISAEDSICTRYTIIYGTIYGPVEDETHVHTLYGKYYRQQMNIQLYQSG